MSSLYQRKIRKRTIILASFFVLWMGGLIFRLIQLQVIEHVKLKAEVLEQNRNIDKIFPKRGTIYDRTGNILARSLPRKSVFCTPFKNETPELQLQKIENLQGVLDLSEREVQTIQRRIEKNSRFIWIKRKIDLEKEEKVNELDLNGIHLTEENKRFYPQGKLASHLLGRVNIDDLGISGVEYKYNSTLEGKIGKRLILRDAKKREYRFEILEEAEPGKDLILTIDETIQYITEKELKNAILKSEAIGGTVIVSQPSTGEILAMANYPTCDLNNPSLKPSQLDRNRAIHHTYEPGSTFKIITASSALEARKVNLDETFDCSKGYIFIAGRAIRDHHRFKILSFPEVIIHSSNVGTIQIGQRIGEDIIYKTIKAFGFGEKTGVDLPAEEKGIFRTLNKWTKISVASLSIGYEISVTAIQMLQALNVIANKGVITPPRIVKKILTSPGKTKESPFQHRRIISEASALKLTSILEKVVQEGTGGAAQINGYRAAGKTGTAHKYNSAAGSYSLTSYTASFVGFVPTDDPVLSMIVVIDEPKGQYYGGQVAAPVFRKIASQVLRYLHIPRHRSLPGTIIAAKKWRQAER